MDYGTGKGHETLRQRGPSGFSGRKRIGNGVTASMLNISHPMTGIMAMDTCSWLRWQMADTDFTSGLGANTGVLSSLPSFFLPARSNRLELNEMKWTHGLRSLINFLLAF